MNPRSRERPHHVVALGGGTGLPMVLRGLRGFTASGELERLTAIVAMSDDGGSSGRLRRSRGVPPPGDVRNCLVALAEEEHLLTGLFQHRYGGEAELGGHTLGNLILAALAEQTGSFLKAVETSSRVLRTVGAILPVTLEDVTLEARLDNGTTVIGETLVADTERQIERVTLRPSSARPTPGVVEAIREADLVVIGPGSLFTSVMPNIVLPEVAAALRETAATKVLVANLVSERREDAGMQLADHLAAIAAHAGGPIVDAILAHHGPVDEATRRRYGAEGSRPLIVSEPTIDGIPVVQRNLLGPGPKLRHDPQATADGLVAAWRLRPARSRSREVS